MEEILRTMKERMPWISVGSKILGSQNIDTSRGWDNSIAKILDKRDRVSEGILRSLLAEHILCGEKSVKLYEFDLKCRNDIQKQISQLEIPESKFGNSYPTTLSSTELKKVDSELIPVKVIRNEDGLGVVFAQKIFLTVREDIRFSPIFNNPESVREEYEEIYGVRDKEAQVFSVVWIPHHRSYIEIRVDLIDGTPPAILHSIHSSVKRAFNRLEIYEIEGNEVNLLSLVKSMYNNILEGSVVELDFFTTTASVKREKMRRTQLDLRKELYHIGGKGNLSTDIEPFRICIRWYELRDGVDYRPEIYLGITGRTNSSTLMNGGGVISNVKVQNCVGLTDYENILDKLNNYLQT